MDGMDSGDVRDLLSTSGDVDPSAPLSAPYLRLLIDRLHLRCSHLRSSALSFAAVHRPSLTAALRRASSAASSSSSLSSSLHSVFLPLSSSDHALDLQIRAIADQVLVAGRELVERCEQLAAASSVSALAARFRAAHDAVRAGRAHDAAVLTAELKGMVGEGMGSDAGQPAVLWLLRKEWAELFDELQVMLAKNVEECVKFVPAEGRVIVSPSSMGSEGVTGLELCVALQALEAIDALDYGMAKVADLIIKHVMVPTISNVSIEVSVEVHKKGVSGNPVSILSIVPSRHLKFKDYKDGSILYSKIIDIIKFIQKFICAGNSTWIHSFGKLSWSRVSDLVITHFLSKAVPNLASKFVEFQDIVRSTTEFENILRSMMFISLDRKDAILTRFLDDVEVHFAVRKRNDILVKARTILGQYDCSKPLALDDEGDIVVDLLFQPEKCSVSRAAFQLIKLVHEALKDACFSSTRVAVEFCSAARDALLLFKAAVPVQLEKQLDGISQVAAVVHNDFFYLSQEILGLAFQYCADFPSGVQRIAVFVDLAPNFYQLADVTLQRQLKIAIINISKAIDGANGFQNTHQPQRYDSAKFSIEQVVFILEKIHIMWESILPTSTYKRSMYHILGSVFSRITKDMLLLDDMAAEETLQLQGLVHLALENLSALLLSLISKNDGKQKFLDHHSWVELDEVIPSLKKFRKLAELLDMSLKSITGAWESGELLSCGFTSSEVQSFIKAIFADSPLRKECLGRIVHTPA